ncbi:isoprenoid synthase domain-containing protein [Mycena crocata]|nr:isoprenoid synthase domain-containing protein [Mycena crocata]
MVSDCLQRLLTEIGYRPEPFPPHDTSYWEPFHEWMVYTLGAASSWNAKQIAELEHTAGGVIDRSYPYMRTDLKLLFAKLTAIAILIDDSIEDEVVYSDILQFSHKVYLGEAQDNGLLALYHDNMKELSIVYGNDAVLRGLAIVPWINYIDACLMEKDIFTAEVSIHYSRGAIHSPWILARAGHMRRNAGSFPHYLRSKSGIAEAYAAGIFKATTEQNFPLKKYIRVLPDLTFYIEVVNDIMSFHKEELAGETHNLVHLRTRALSSSGAQGTGVGGEWTTYDTFSLLCDEVKDATRRIDGLLRLEDCEKTMKGESGGDGVDDVDVELAKQWRGWRDGYISWHIECRRYKLGFLTKILAGGPLEH